MNKYYITFSTTPKRVIHTYYNTTYRGVRLVSNS